MRILREVGSESDAIACDDQTIKQRLGVDWSEINENAGAGREVLITHKCIHTHKHNHNHMLVHQFIKQPKYKHSVEPTTKRERNGIDGLQFEVLV